VEASNRPGPIGMIGTALLGLAGSLLDGLFARYAIGLHHRHSRGGRPSARWRPGRAAPST
jgi:hypothetical protein